MSEAGKTTDPQATHPTSHDESSIIPDEMTPNRYIEKVELDSGRVVEGPIEPEELLVSHHRDYHLADVQAQRFMSRVVADTGDEDHARSRMREVREMGHKASERIARWLGGREEKVSKALFGLARQEYYFRYRRHGAAPEQLRVYSERLQRKAERQLQRARKGGLRILLTGGTGFVGKEILHQIAEMEGVTEVVVLIRPKTIRDRGGEVIAVRSPAERGLDLLRELGIEGDRARRFRFLAGDVEQPRLGVSEVDLAQLEQSLTHVIHCAASVAFDDPYDASFRANVLGTLNALRFSWDLQEAEESPFVAHLGIETSYIHGRQTRKLAREDEVVFPRNFYNNYYELTKAMASLETERFMLAKGLRVVQLCPAIVIGESRAGNNRGDTKVVNAPVNLFGRAKEAMRQSRGGWMQRSKASMLGRMACIFPGDPSAEINLIPVDWVARGILAALERPQAVAERIHLATDRRITSERMIDILQTEVGVKVKLAEPATHRNVTLPVLTKVLGTLGQPRLAEVLEKLGNIFGGYSEWGQPVHEVGNDVRLLGLPAERPDTERAFRMLCRHNRFVQDFGKVKDPDEIARREALWSEFVARLEEETGTSAGALPAREFRRALRAAIDLETFERRSGAG